MANYEEVIKALKMCTEPHPNCPDCPYYADKRQCSLALVKDAFELLTEKNEPVKPIKRLGIVEPFKCGACNWVLGWETDFPRFCPLCGRKVKWND